MRTFIKTITSGFGLLIVLALAAGYGYFTAPESQASVQLPVLTVNPTTTEAPQILTPATIVKAPGKRAQAPGRSRSITTTTLAPIDPELVARIPGPGPEATDWTPEVDAMGEEVSQSDEMIATP